MDGRGARVVAVSDVTTGIVNPDGLDLALLSAWVSEHRFLRGCPAGRAVDRLDVLTTACDVLIPAALEGQITAENAHRLDCRLVLEAANGPTTPAADRILAEREIRLVPDVLVNAGGVTVSYFEWVQDQQKLAWDDAEVARRLHAMLRAAFARVLGTSQRLGCDWRTAAQAVALERVAQAAELRSIYP